MHLASAAIATLRRLSLGLLMAVSITVSVPAAAHAVLCALPAPTLAERIEDADWVFTGRQTFRWFWHSWDDGPHDRVVRVAVVDVYKGTVPAFVEVKLDYQNTSIDSLGPGRTGFVVNPRSDGMVQLEDCGGAARVDELAAHFAGAPTEVRIVPYLWRPLWAPIVVLLAMGAGVRWYPPEDLNEALGLTGD